MTLSREDLNDLVLLTKTDYLKVEKPDHMVRAHRLRDAGLIRLSFAMGKAEVYSLTKDGENKLRRLGEI